MPDSPRTFLLPPSPDPVWEFSTLEQTGAEWVRAHDGSLVNLVHVDAIALRKVGEESHEVRAVYLDYDREPVLFRGTFQQAGDVMANLGDALGAYVPTTAEDRDPEEDPAP